MTPEAKVKNAVRKILDNYADKNVYYFFVPQNGYGRAGVPDIVGCAGGQFFAIECKAGRGTTTALQDKEILKIQKSLGFALVIREDNIADVQELMESLVG